MTTTEVRKTETKDVARTRDRDDRYHVVPAADIYETDNEYVIKADMPGVKKENLEIMIEDNELLIVGRIDVDGSRLDNLKYCECRLYDFRRSFIVGDTVDRNGISANLEDGVLTLTLPKSELVKPKKIEIKTEK